MTATVTRDDLRTNYSKLGTALIERLYGDDFLSLSGEESSDRMIELAGISAGSRVLDVGSGVGGPALHLAEKTGCTITGVDIIEWNVEEANNRSAARGLAGKAGFQVGDATALPFADASFDTVWSPDAWCLALPAITSVELEGRRVWIRGWLYECSGALDNPVPVILLDTDLPLNAPEDRRITDRLYGGDQAYRVKQEAVLGIGGVRMLAALGLEIERKVGLAELLRPGVSPRHLHVRGKPHGALRVLRRLSSLPIARAHGAVQQDPVELRNVPSGLQAFGAAKAA